MLMTCILAAATFLFAEDKEEGCGAHADAVLRCYLDMAAVPGSLYERNGRRAERENVLALLAPFGEVGIKAIAHALPQVREPWIRAELASALGRNCPSMTSASVLSDLLKDPDADVRSAAILSLRWISSRVPMPYQKGDGPLPRVDGLVPQLVEALKDDVPRNRIGAVLALRDARDPKAVPVLRETLSDPDEGVRFHAACALTDYGDNGGLPVLKERLRRLDELGGIGEYYELKPLFSSLERITGRSFGTVSMTAPTICSNMEKAKEIERHAQVVLDAWLAWLTHESKTGNTK